MIKETRIPRWKRKWISSFHLQGFVNLGTLIGMIKVFDSSRLFCPFKIGPSVVMFACTRCLTHGMVCTSKTGDVMIIKRKGSRVFAAMIFSPQNGRHFCVLRWARIPPLSRLTTSLCSFPCSRLVLTLAGIKVKKWRLLWRLIIIYLHVPIRLYTD